VFSQSQGNWRKEAQFIFQSSIAKSYRAVSKIWVPPCARRKLANGNRRYKDGINPLNLGMGNTIISVKNLVKNYGNFQAVKGISFEVFEGEIFGLLGPNGAGKSTTLEIIETLRKKTSGEVIVDGLNLDKQPDQIKKIIGVQLQSSGYYPGLNLLQLIELFCGLYNRKVDPMELLEMVNLKEKAKAKFKELSGGQKQRFSVATTLINEPRIIFLDEPTTGLDPQARRSLWELVKNIRARGTTVIITTHYMDEAEYLCDRVAIIDSGKIIALDSPDKMVDKLIASGFERPKEVKKANLEDVFIKLTGHSLREE
jgi:ABC-2 type transport system ATP-binding protein